MPAPHKKENLIANKLIRLFVVIVIMIILAVIYMTYPIK